MPESPGEGENPVCRTLEECAERKAHLFCEYLDQEEPAQCLTLLEKLRDHSSRPDQVNEELVKLYGADQVKEAKHAVAEKLRSEHAPKAPAS
ncbi:MAG: hypothetical protein KGJ23_08170 [Euryarchaeota archaeon]|nr:hypothetical protein [Euryarchaeota archaeon]MDE1836577.1 hypothetical protein [Euryarchaeota archaeon]MDE1879228.1 hypothetical protein [Euryarchaeota archaeon]MDE2044547.1 hypothetical protein [Thermoplasmata archaeon]